MQAHDPTTRYVSVTVLTFNSVGTVIETLESIRSQTDCQIELIVSDDGSTDGTQAVVTQWITAHQKAFVACHVIFNPVNVGICQNVKGAYAKATGEWIKPIAGDDLLMPNAISVLYRHARSAADDIGLIVGRLQAFSVSAGKTVSGEILPSDAALAELSENARGLSRKLASANTIPAPAVLIRRRFVEACGGIDEHFVHLDDWPLWLNMLKAGARIEITREVIVAYRIHGAAITTRRCAATMNPKFLMDLITFYNRYQRRYFPVAERLDKFIYVMRWRLALGICRNRPSAYRATALLHVVSPLQWRERLHAAMRRIALPREN